MIRTGDIVRKLLFKLLSFENYLRVLSKLYFLSFNMGLLRKNRLYQYPYFLNKIINKGDVCIDLGANMGYFTVLLSKITGSRGKVYAVEPIKPILSVLKKNTKNLKNVKIHPFALGKENKFIKLGNNSKKKKGFISSGSHYILDQKLDQTTDPDIKFDGEMKKGSELFYHIDRLDFIKCDIEGYERVVIPEIEPIILKFKPILLIEARGENRIQMLQFFAKNKFSAFVLNNGKLHPARENEFLDILFVPQNKLENVSKYLSN